MSARSRSRPWWKDASTEPKIDLSAPEPEVYDMPRWASVIECALLKPGEFWLVDGAYWDLMKRRVLDAGRIEIKTEIKCP